MKDLWISVSGATSQQRKVDTLANNMANVNTPGFKRDNLTFREYLTVLDKGYDDIDIPDKEWSLGDFYRSYGAERGQVMVDGSYTDFSQGPLNFTNNTFDLALQGFGFFEVLTPSGIRYTRKGHFTRSSDGFLVTDDGFYVLKKGRGEARMRRIGVNSRDFVVNDAGGIIIDGEDVGKISVVDFDTSMGLRKEGDSLFIGNETLQESSAVVRQRFLEGSNVNAISEMSELIKANRNFESIRNMIRAYDNISTRAVNDIAKF